MDTAPPSSSRRDPAVSADDSALPGDQNRGSEPPEQVKRVAVDLLAAYADHDRRALERAVPVATDHAAEVVSELKVLAAFLSRRVQETGVVWKPADSREAVARTVAEMLPPELEFAVSTAWEAHSLGEEEIAERFTLGDPMIYAHMLAAFCAAIGLAVYERAELVATLRRVNGTEG